MLFFFFFQAEDGIRDIGVTGVQTCALPICRPHNPEESGENKNRLYEIVAWAENEFHECLLRAPAGERARRYLKDRGISAQSISQFKLGYHPDNWQWLLERARGRY